MHRDISHWKEKFKITHSLVAPDGSLSLHGLAYCMQETAVNHADAAGMGYEDLIRHNQAWVLTRQIIKIFRMPALNEKITIDTWAHHVTDTMAIRDFNILDHDGKLTGISRTSWMILDLVARRPVRLSTTLQEKIPLLTGRLSEDLSLDKISIPDDASASNETFRVVYSDLDMNQHVNNINYLKWVLDGFDYDFRQTHRLQHIGSNFLAEALLGDTLARVNKTMGDLEFLTKIVNSDTSKPILTSMTKWVPKDTGNY